MNTEHPIPNTSADKPAFCIDSDRAADWFLKQLAALDAERALLLEQHTAALARLDSDRDGLLHLYGGELQHYMAILAQPPKMYN